MTENLYVHFPFCRAKCAYCSLYSRAGVSPAARAEYVERLAAYCRNPGDERWRIAPGSLKTVYFGGGTPALAPLGPLLRAIEPLRAEDCEFTVELHPNDVTERLLDELKAGGVNRISMGLQSLNDETLAAMGRGHTVAEAHRAFDLIRSRFENAGVDVIIGFPSPSAGLAEVEPLIDLFDWGVMHCSIYTLILEERTALAKRVNNGSAKLLDDDQLMDAKDRAVDIMSDMCFVQYEISNFCRRGYMCRHNLAVWRGEDYLGLGSGAHGRIGLWRTVNLGPFAEPACEISSVESKRDEVERRIFGLRTYEGLDTSDHPEWPPVLDRFVEKGLLRRMGDYYSLTRRGSEVCDSILAELV